MQKATSNKYHGKKKLLFNSEQVWKKSSRIKKSPSAIFGKSEKSSPDKQIKPGPGSYDVNKTFLDKGLISFKGARRIRCQTEAPGQVAANFTQNRRQNPHLLSLSKQLISQKGHNHAKTQNSPSPASYQVSRTVKVLTHSFSRKKRQFLQDKEKQNIPGPAQYKINKKEKSPLQFSFSHTKKFKQTEKEQTEKKSMPGPGAYEISKKRQHIKSYKFTTALRNFSHFQQHPGPSYYSPQKSELEHIGGVISKELRKFQYQSNVPGPGAYDQVSIDIIKLKEPRPIIPQSRQSRIQTNPQMGPGCYFQKEQKAKAIGGVIGREKRNSTTVELLPGPLTYQPHYYEVLSRTVSTVIGRQKRMKDCFVSTPGPGQYQNDKNQRFFSNSKWKRSSEDRRLNFTQILKQKVEEPQRFDNHTALSHK